MIKTRYLLLILFMSLAACASFEDTDEGRYMIDISFANQSSDSIYVFTTFSTGILDTNVAFSGLCKISKIGQEGERRIRHEYVPRFTHFLQVLVIRQNTLEKEGITNVVANNINDGYFVIPYKELKKKNFQLSYSNANETL